METIVKKALLVVLFAALTISCKDSDNEATTPVAGRGTTEIDASGNARAANSDAAITNGAGGYEDNTNASGGVTREMRDENIEVSGEGSKIRKDSMELPTSDR